MQSDHTTAGGNDSLLAWVPRLRRYARALVSNRDDADDLVQDTLERALTRAALWRGVADMRAWLFGVMHNLHVDGVRRPKLHTVVLDDDTPEVPVAAAQSERLAVLDLQAALERLPVEQREIILLVALEDMSYAEVAATLGIPIGSVMSRLSRGRARLQSLMDGQPDTVHLKVVK
ncbi:MAG: RNA polymerase subunit sigma-24 [Polaromonas sp. 39-63-203]|uniref:RNA polymerase sigma factor n=1 Tax=Polaromonas sp. TaxID=1869339 RepID=UPI000BD8173E|nr:sigma-70 family RNA polymerase sigma factor [Polaromonas sp.]OYY52919.1 MAG: RNA polymerase subunit sigma-24 [Polaromonas sp. 35-63-240]OYY99244.1 MAG: RNA polymerase subunit sigma-24 [Polaromonas sp. 28-63-22]OYZ84001.1 MAG: RNA polymerase subunit sigma-24 [Polaromonas sp. 24-62-144]OZA98863.1 MAG: RNA polymerase subunit sigma-24 [Polaromonas sp. 39-63-203]HQS32881.1 sigma-70 family RNA polymerase sigma factor [Polaromonas sp.]